MSNIFTHAQEMNSPILRFFDEEQLALAKKDYEAQAQEFQFYEDCSSFLSLYILLSRFADKTMVLSFVPNIKMQLTFTVQEPEAISLSSDDYMAKICEYYQLPPSQESTSFQYFHNRLERLEFLKFITPKPVWDYFEVQTKGLTHELEEILNYEFPVLDMLRSDLENRTAQKQKAYDIQRIYCHLHSIEGDIKEKNVVPQSWVFHTLSGYKKQEVFLEHIAVIDTNHEAHIYYYHENLSYAAVNALQEATKTHVSTGPGAQESWSEVFSKKTSDSLSGVYQDSLNLNVINSRYLKNYNPERQDMILGVMGDSEKDWLQFEKKLCGSYYPEFKILCEKQKIKDYMLSPSLLTTPTQEGNPQENSSPKNSGFMAKNKKNKI